MYPHPPSSQSLQSLQSLPLFQSFRLSRSPRSASRRGRFPRLVVGAVCLISLLALAGCGVTVNVSGPGGANTPGAISSPGGAGDSSPGTIPGGVGGTAVRPCTGAAVAPSKTPTIVLTVNNSYKTTQAHVGDVIEVQLDAMTHWSSPDNSNPSVLSALQPQGGMDEASKTCRWLYEVVARGTVMLNFSGAPICESNVACPAIARAESFTIQVS